MIQKHFYVLDTDVGKGSLPHNVSVALYYCENVTFSSDGTSRNLTTDNSFTFIFTYSPKAISKKLIVTLRKRNSAIASEYKKTKNEFGYVLLPWTAYIALPLKSSTKKMMNPIQSIYQALSTITQF